MVDPDAEAVEADLRAGRIKCPRCGSGLRPWGYARARWLRDHGRPVGIRPRRSICRTCANTPGAQKTHVLLPKIALLRRADTVTTIGEALEARHLGRCRRGELAQQAGVHMDTLRGWLRRFAERAEEVRVLFTRRWGHAEDTVRLEAAFRRGLESAGVPRAVFVDRGSAFMSAAFHRTLATLGIRIIHSRAGYPASRGKVERFFATVRSQFLVGLAARGGAKDLSELNELFGAWLDGVYHRSPHGETKQTPLERRLTATPLRRPSPAELHEAFLWSERRLVSKTARISLFGNRYEVDPALVGVRVELLFDPFDLSQIEVR
jgi:putative transposase